MARTTAADVAYVSVSNGVVADPARGVKPDSVIVAGAGDCLIASPWIQPIVIRWTLRAGIVICGFIPFVFGRDPVARAWLPSSLSITDRIGAGFSVSACLSVMQPVYESDRTEEGDVGDRKIGASQPARLLGQIPDVVDIISCASYLSNASDRVGLT